MTPIGTWAYAAGASGEVDIPAGASVRQIMAWGGGTVTIFGGQAIPVTTQPFVLRFDHDLVQATRNNDSSGNLKLLFTGTTGYFVEYTKAGNT